MDEGVRDTQESQCTERDYLKLFREIYQQKRDAEQAGCYFSRKSM